jgi:thiamine kinase-like enzyme
MIVSLEDCLPANLQSTATTITRIAAGFSGAGVYRVEALGQTFVLKISDEGELPAVWRRKVHIQELAANAGLTPRVVHVDETRRAVVSAFAVDRSFRAFYGDPRTRDTAIAQLSQTVRRVHELPLPPGAESRDPRDLLANIWAGLDEHAALPRFVGEAVQRGLTEVPTANDRALVLSHNDVNPTNLLYDGRNVLLLDWDAAGPNDPLYDLATVAVFLRMDEQTCQRLLTAYDGEQVATLPAGFVYLRRLVAVTVGTMFLRLARQDGHTSTSAEATLEATLSLGDCYQRMRNGELNVATGEGKFTFGLALIRESVTF